MDIHVHQSFKFQQQTHQLLQVLPLILILPGQQIHKCNKLILTSENFIKVKRNQFKGLHFSAIHSAKQIQQ